MSSLGDHCSTLCAVLSKSSGRVPLRILSTLRMLSTLMLGFVFLGCSSNSDQPSVPTGGVADSGSPSADAENSSVVATNTSTDSRAARKSVQRGPDEIWVDENGQKWFGKVPYDVFFDQPLTVASNQAPIGGQNMASAAIQTPAVANPGMGSFVNSTTESSASTSPPATDNSAETSVVTTEGGDSQTGWQSLISGKVLDEEVKSIRNFMNENLQSVGNYNSSMLMIPPKAAAMAVLANVALEHPDDVSWKDDAIYVRDLAKQMNSGPLQRGAKDQRRLLGLFESVSDTLNRSRPAGLPDPSEEDSFADVAEMRLIMMRMEEAEKRMRTEAGSESSFASNKTMVQHEAAILATMTHTITLAGYGYEDDPEFVGYGQAIVEAAKSIMTASEAGDFATYEVALSKISTTCQSCHSQYKND